MKTTSKRWLFYSLLTTSFIPIVATTACNIRVKREIKNENLNDRIWESEEWKTLEKMIQNKFKQQIINDMFTNFVYKYTNPNNSEQVRLSWLTRSKTKEQLDRAFLNKKRGTGNYATDKLANTLTEIRENKLIPVKYKLLLNKISTIYNRTINVYPTKIFNKEIEGDKYLHLEFRADLITPMKRRFVKKFLDLQIDFPIFDRKYTQLNLRKFYKITQLNSPTNLAQEIETANQMENIWLSTIRTDQGIRKPGNGIIDETNALAILGTKQLLNLNSGFYPLNNAKNDLYNPTFTGRINDPKAPKSYIFANWCGLVLENPTTNEDGVITYLIPETNKEFVTLKNTDKVSKLEMAIQKHFFTESKMLLFKSLFGKDGKWQIKVEAQTWAGNPASNYTIADWVENIGHRSNFVFYMIKKDDPSESYYYKSTAGMARVQEVG